jgi:uncharacterized membrane protein YphA (DoxX/SURF4 family)
MNGISYALALGLAAVFAVAGVGKLRHPARTARAFRSLHVPVVLAGVVPRLEVLLAAGIVVAPATALAAVVLLGGFSIVLARADDGVSCACFGSASTTPVSWVQQVRNGALAGVALVASTSTPTVPALAAVLVAAGIGALVALGLALAELHRRTGAVLAVRLP